MFKEFCLGCLVIASSLIWKKEKLAKMVTRCHSLSFVVPLVITRCHSLSFVVTRCTTRLSFYKKSKVKNHTKFTYYFDKKYLSLIVTWNYKRLRAVLHCPYLFWFAFFLQQLRLVPNVSIFLKFLLVGISSSISLSSTLSIIIIILSLTSVQVKVRWFSVTFFLFFFVSEITSD